MSNIIKFPRRQQTSPTGYRINLYTEEEISIVLLCCNIREDQDSHKKYMKSDLRTLDPVFVINRMYGCIDGTLLSRESKETIKKITNAIEVISLSTLNEAII